MNRLGFAPQEFAAALERIRHLSPRELRLMTHLACADERDARVTTAQLARFREATQGLDYETSIVNSAGLLADVRPRVTGCGPGLRSMAHRPSRMRPPRSLALSP